MTHREQVRRPVTQAVTEEERKGACPCTMQQKRADQGAGVQQLQQAQERADGSPGTVQMASIQRMANRGAIQRRSAPSGGLPDDLRGGLEQLSGFDLSTVRVHYNSPEPSRIQAHAYTQGQDIHVAPGQQKHLPHEGWHAVQQMQGRVRPTIHSQGVAINDDPGLEREADVMGSKALQRRSMADIESVVEDDEG